jgi:hypothetical protein
MCARLLLCVAFTIALGLTTRVAHSATANEAALAREQVRVGVTAAQEGRWQDALDAFRRAYALVPKATTLLNVASAEVRTGKLVSGAESYRKVARAPEGEVTEEQRDAARRALADVEPRIAHLRVMVENPAPGDRVELDGVVLSGAALGADLPVDPGSHEVRLLRAGAEAARTSRSLGEGESATVFLSAPERAQPSKSHGGIFASPWFWTGVGAIVVGGTFAVLCATTLCEGPSPHSGTLGAVKLP